MARDLEDGERIEVAGSGSAIYTLKNTGGVYTCSCPAWRNQGAPPERRTCKHLRALRGAEAEAARLGSDVAAPAPAVRPSAVDKDVPPLLLAHVWEPDTDLTGWWMSEKLDGVRTYWNGTQFISRLGNPFIAPDWFVESLPRDLPLDGELFAGRKKFQRTVGIVRRQDRSDAWRELAACAPSRTRCGPATPPTCGPTRTPAARARRTCGPSWRGSSPSAARA
jgi:DNA ligase-1